MRINLHPGGTRIASPCLPHAPGSMYFTPEASADASHCKEFTMFDSNNLLTWCIGPLLGWALVGVLIGVPVHTVFGVPRSSVALFVVIQCILQIAVSPWLFAARATADNPAGRPLRRWVTVIVWLTLATFAVDSQMLDGDLTNRGAVVIFLGGPLLLGVISVLAVRWQFQKRQRS